MEEELFSVTVDRPIGSAHPDYPSLVYPVNYGYIEGVMAPDGEEQDAYVIGVDSPVDRFTGKRIAIVHRRDDIEDKWVIAPENVPYNKQQIEEMVYFQEQYFDSYVEMLDEEMWDAYNHDGEKLGYQIPRSMAKSLSSGVFHIAVMVYVRRDDGYILTTQRSRNKTNPLKWEVTGGSILAGETPVQGAVRELLEETGIAKKPSELTEVYNCADDNRHCIYYIYVTNVPCDTQIHLQIGETMDYAFLPYDEFRELVCSDRFVASEQGRFKAHEEIMRNVLNADDAK